MATNLIKGQGRTIMPMSPRLQGLNATNELTEGVAASFPILGIKGSRWHYRFHGEDTVIPDPRNPRDYAQSLNVVIVQASPTLSRTFYPPGSYVEGANNRPDCWSSDGVRPDETVPAPINPVCATCPNAMWGSGATPAAPRAQACQQRRRVVLVPYGADLTNESGGGPMLLSVPPGSLRDLQDYGMWLKSNGLEVCGVVTELRFDSDPNIAFPKVIFDYSMTLANEEVDVVIDQLRNSEPVLRILNSQINVDGPEVDDGAPSPQVAPGAAAQANIVKPPPGAAARPAPAKPQSAPPPPQPQTVKAAPQPNIPPQPGKVGGFGVPAQGVPPPPTGATITPIRGPATRSTQPLPAGRAAPPPPPPRQQAPITTAVGQPAPPPPSTRTVRTAAPTQPVVPPTVPPSTSSGGNGEDAEATTVTTGIGAELDAAFGDVMSRM